MLLECFWNQKKTNKVAFITKSMQICTKNRSFSKILFTKQILLRFKIFQELRNHLQMEEVFLMLNFLSYQGPLSSKTSQIGLESLSRKKNFRVNNVWRPSPKVAFTRWFITHWIALQSKSYPAIWISVSEGRLRSRRGRDGDWVSL